MRLVMGVGYIYPKRTVYFRITSVRGAMVARQASVDWPSARKSPEGCGFESHRALSLAFSFFGTFRVAGQNLLCRS